MSHYAEIFHNESGTLTPPVKGKVEVLRSGDCIVLMTAHQPNLFPYSGVLRKATLNFVLGRKLEERLKVPVVSFFGIADQDFTDDRWVKSFQLPSVTRRSGILEIEMSLPEKLMLNKVAKPSSEVLSNWKSNVQKWLEDTVRSIERLCKASIKDPSFANSTPLLGDNFEDFWDIVEDSYDRSETYSDFTAFMMSKIVNDAWGYDTIFSRFSECQQAFVDEFSLLLTRFADYSASLRKAKELPHMEGINGGVSDREFELAPFWYHCECGSKARLSLFDGAGTLMVVGKCVSCGRCYELDLGSKDNPNLSNIAARISARSISMTLVFFKALLPSCYIGGIGGMRYLMEAQHVAKEIGIPFPPLAVWRPHDRYLGLGQMEALLQLKHICSHFGVNDYSMAKDLLEDRINVTHESLKQLDTSKSRILEEMKKNPPDEALKEELREISMSQTRIKNTSELSLISRELAILLSIPIVLDLMPSVIDHAVNIGLKETSDQWIRYLIENGNLSSDVHLVSIMGKNTGLCQTLLTDMVYHSDELKLKMPLPME